MITWMLHGFSVVCECTRERQRRVQKNVVYPSPILAEAQQQRSYVDLQQQPVNPFVVTYSKQAMPPQHSDTAFIPCFNLCWCIHKAGQEWARGTHRSRNQSVLPSAFLRGSNPQQEMAATVFSIHFFVSVDLNPSEQGEPFSSYLSDGAFLHKHPIKLLLESWVNTSRELQASLVCCGCR